MLDNLALERKIFLRDRKIKFFGNNNLVLMRTIPEFMCIYDITNVCDNQKEGRLSEE